MQIKAQIKKNKKNVSVSGVSQQPQPQTLPLLTPPLCTVRWFAKTQTLTVFHSCIDNFKAKIQILRPMSCHYFSLRNIFVIDQKDLSPLKMRVTGHLKLHSMVSHRLFHRHRNLKTKSAFWADPVRKTKHSTGARRRPV